MAADPFAFYRGSACVFYADVAGREDRWAGERTGRVWIQGDLHAENFGTYMDGAGVLVFDVNDFDEAFVGHFTWDLQRFAASVALLCWQKALSDSVIRDLIATFARAYLDQVRWFPDPGDDASFSLNLDTAKGAVLSALQQARVRRARGCSTGPPRSRSRTAASARAPACGGSTRPSATRSMPRSRLPGDHPEVKRFGEVAYDVKDIVGRTGFGIGSAGLPPTTC